ncbi:MAG: GNAT family N-acetyltransferase [Chloroflexi bacterium]|nr:GNAT family N-acetyltransferase [Chloroflexota bacterium]
MTADGRRLTADDRPRPSQVVSSPSSVVPAVILPATFRDLNQARALERVCFGPEGWGTLELFFALLFPNTVRLKAVADDQLVGLVIGDRQPWERMGWVATLGVLPNYQRRGIGGALLAACESVLGQPRVRLTVRLSNQAAIALYRQVGYQRVSVWHGYYSGGEDGLVMEKTVNN